MTTFTYNGTTVTMELDPLHPREYSEEKKTTQGFDSTGDPYTYDPGTPIVRIEALTFPAIAISNLNSLCSFIEGVVFGRQYAFSWYDNGTTRTARYAGMSWQQVSDVYYRVNLTLEVLS